MFAVLLLMEVVIMQRRIARTLRLGAVSVALGVIAAGTLNAGTAHAAAVSRGQLMKPVSDYVCGHNERVTDTLSVSGGVLVQKALIYRHCGTGTVRRKADVKGTIGTDGPCMTIAAGEAKVLEAIYVGLARTTYNGVFTC